MKNYVFGAMSVFRIHLWDFDEDKEVTFHVVTTNFEEALEVAKALERPSDKCLGRFIDSIICLTTLADEKDLGLLTVVPKDQKELDMLIKNNDVFSLEKSLPKNGRFGYFSELTEKSLK